MSLNIHQRKRIELYDKTNDTQYTISFYFSVEGVGLDEEVIDILRNGVDLGDIRTVMERMSIRECWNGGRHLPCIVVIEGEIGQVRLFVSLSFVLLNAALSAKANTVFQPHSQMCRAHYPVLRRTGWFHYQRARKKDCGPPVLSEM